MFPNQKNSASQSRLFRGALIGLLAGSISGAFAFDSFETPSPTWQVRDHDGPLRVLRHQRVFDQAHSGSGSEFVEFEAEQGTYVHLAHSIRPSLIHADLRPHLWVRAERPGARLAARVVLPHTKDQRTGQPRSLLVHGNSYALTGQWQQLVVSEIPTRLQRQLRALRAQTQQPWDDREAYIDMVVVNAYQGPRLNRIWLDDLDVRGHVESQTPALASAYRSQRTTVEVRGDTLLLDQAPRFLRIARYRGEPLHVFRDLGFNAVYTDLAATEDLLANAHANGLWVIAAPPSKPLGPIAGQLIAWTTGPLVGEAMAETAAARAAAARRAKPANRPVVGDFLRIDREAAVNTDILLIGDVARNNAVDARRYQDFLRRQSTQGRLKMPLWARLELDPSPTWRRQLEALGLDSPQRLLPSLQQIRAEAFAAATAGARGILIDTRAPLSAAVSDPRAALVFLLNAELATLEPWFAGGVASRLHQADPDWQVTQIATARSRLLIGLRYGPQQQLLDPMLPRERLTLVSPPIAGAGRGFRVSRGRLESMISRRVPGGDQVTIEDAESIEAIVLSQDPLVLNHLSQRLDSTIAQRAQRANTLAFHQVGLTAETLRRLSDQQDDQSLLQAAREHLAEEQRLARAGKHLLAFDQTRKVLFELGKVQRSQWEREVTGLEPMLSPALLSFGALPLHRNLRTRTSTLGWSGNVLGGANLEDRASVEQAGWINHRSKLNESWHTDVSFLGAGTKAGRGCLRLACTTLARGKTYPHVSPVIVHSPPVTMRLGQVARISGWIKVPHRLTGLDGLLIHDNLGGRDLAMRVHHADQWTHFEFYRVAWAPGPLVVTWELTEAGEAWIDEVSVEVANTPPGT